MEHGKNFVLLIGKKDNQKTIVLCYEKCKDRMCQVNMDLGETIHGAMA